MVMRVNTFNTREKMIETITANEYSGNYFLPSEKNTHPSPLK